MTRKVVNQGDECATDATQVMEKPPRVSILNFRRLIFGFTNHVNTINYSIPKLTFSRCLVRNFYNCNLDRIRLRYVRYQLSLR